MGSHSVTCHPAEVTFPPLPQTFKAGVSEQFLNHTSAQAIRCNLDADEY